MKTLPLRYKIPIVKTFNPECVEVWGHAVDSPYLFCVRDTGAGFWQADDYLTGYKMGGYTFSKEECITEAIARIERQAPGHYAKCQQAALRNLKIAGLI